ncbi:Flagellar motor rotation protein MotB [Rhodovulum sp. P5]|uniref:peptidoglycan -binding protein n=1 Tax=Rhodovulum sp. P5 TaxID=1564506 RepID=UPI0009C36D8C|nr:peptidoglycan -binding protein [Rhodovulum sp. P5]ARE39557.1 Flagellar motor rotation protein MotB [Rhodovulum sp. P5]
MALTRRGGNRFQASIWPGFVDAMTALLLVLMFVLSIFMIMQVMLKETITGQETELSELGSQLSALANALGIERTRTAELEEELGTLGSALSEARAEAETREALIASLQGRVAAQAADLEAAGVRIADFETQVARLLTERDAARTRGAALTQEIAELEATRADLEQAQQALMSEQEQLQFALAAAREAIDAGVEAARLAAAKREALEALIADLKTKNSDSEAARHALEGQVADLRADLSEEEAARLAEAAAAEALRRKLAGSEDELTAMTLVLEEERRKAEETLTLLAAAEAAKQSLGEKLTDALAAGDALGNNLAAVAAEKQALGDRLGDALAKGQALGEQLSTQMAALDRAGDDLADADRARQALEADLKRARAEIAALRNEVGDKAEIERRLAAALAAKLAAEQAADQNLSAAEQRAALLAEANRTLQAEEARSAEDRRKLALLNQQVAALRADLGNVLSLLEQSEARESQAQVQIDDLGARLNVALAQAAAEQRARAELEAAERQRLEEEAQRLADEARRLETYRSEFFGELRQLLAGRPGVRIEGDRFVFSSEVLFQIGSATLSEDGKEQIAKVVSILRDVADQIPAEIDWILRVDGHTDNAPLVEGAAFADNWELSQARALSVVRFMVDDLGFPPDRLAAAGFGEYQPVEAGDSPEARAHNRRIELKLTER